MAFGANQLPAANYLSSFPSNLLGIAGEWYANLQPRLATWDDLRKAFLLRCRLQVFQNHLMDRLMAHKMGVHENIDSYYNLYLIGGIIIRC